MAGESTRRPASVLRFAAMLDLPRMKRIRLSARPRFQRFIGTFGLMPNYSLPPKVRIDVEGLERAPEGPVLWAMNHTDRYNYWPFQYALWRRAGRFTATWVKGKYYENELLGRFMEKVNSVPTVSRGYLITKDFQAAMGRKPTDDEYRALRDQLDAGDDRVPELPGLEPLLTTPRNVLGLPFDPARETWPRYLEGLYRAMMRRFVELHDEAFRLGLDLLVFPQGTRSLRLSRGRPGLSQVALHWKIPIVPVGCSGSDKVYPGSSPWAKGGHIVYRVGEPLRYEDLRQFHTPEPFEPFTREAETRHAARFQALADLVMERIEPLVDEPYRFSGDRASDGEQGTRRFV